MKKLLTIFVITVLCIINSFSICYSAVPITKEKLQNAFENILNNNESEENFKINKDSNVTFEDSKIKVVTEGEESIIKYDLSNKPTFTSEIKVMNGMSYEEFEKENEKLTSNVLGYIAVANIQGVKIEDSILYFVTNYLKNALESENDNKYVIIDDNPNTTVSVEGKTIIKKSEFPNNVMKYVNSLYSKDKMNFNDNDKYNTFEWTIEKKEITDNSCTLISTIKVNLDGDFSKIEGIYNKLVEGIKNGSSSENEVKNYIQDNSKLPQTGKNIELVDILYIIIGISTISMLLILIMGYKYRKGKI